ncbi:hypothetical protein QOZ80_9BG0712040 [Eleusine coracana subsp. coracana]|nr:hypothetical protein QOZ80_9BG0712040 [Eleusine coracana subsp. coracana]
MVSRAASPYVVLLLRLITLALLAASLAIIATDKFTDNSFPGVPPQKYTFKDVYAFRYLLAVAVIGCAYTLLQIPFAVVSIVRRKRVVGGTYNVALLLVFVDVVAALLLATGAAAGLGFTYDAKRYADSLFDGVEAPELVRLHRDVNKFLALAFASSGLMLGAAVCVAITVMVCVYSLVK